MKDVDKMSDSELRNELRETRGLLAAARCPDFGCVLGNVTGKKIGEGLWEQHECQWCAERSRLLATDLHG